MKRKQKRRLLMYIGAALTLIAIVAIILMTGHRIGKDNNVNEAMKVTTPTKATLTEAIPTEATPTEAAPTNALLERPSKAVQDPKESLEDAVEVFLTRLPATSAGSMVSIADLDQKTIAKGFYFESINEDVFSRMKEKSFGKDCTIPKDKLRYVRVLHYGFDEKVYIGELIVDKRIAQDIVDIFFELYQAAYPIEKMLLIDNYDADDEQSMSDNNTSCFNFRVVAGSSQLSNHASGLAIDINPLYNPYVKTNGETTMVSPKKGELFADRTKENPYYIKKGDVCYLAFTSRGFTWGGDWNTVKDYQHFEKKMDN